VQIDETPIALEIENDELQGNLNHFQYQDIPQHFKADNDWEFRLHNSGKTLSFLHLELRNGFHVCKEVQVRVQTMRTCRKCHSCRIINCNINVITNRIDS